MQKDESIQTLDARRFRGNIIRTFIYIPPFALAPPFQDADPWFPLVSGAEEYDEDEWKLVQLKKSSSMQEDDVIFDVSCRTVR